MDVREVGLRSGMDTWQMIKIERAALLPRLLELAPSDWDKPSLCANWSVRDVIAHLIASASTTPVRFLTAFAASAFRPRRMLDKQISDLVDSRSDGDLLQMYRRRADARTGPPGPPVALLGEAIIHGDDILRAVQGTGVPHPVEHVVAALDFYKNANVLIGAKGRVEGLHLRATDAEWEHGTGRQVRGPAIALLLAMTGRAVTVDELSGDGADELRRRLERDRP